MKTWEKQFNFGIEDFLLYYFDTYISCIFLVHIYCTSSIAIRLMF